MAKAASAKRHAQAIFQIALDRKEVGKWRSELKTITATLTDPQLEDILAGRESFSSTCRDPRDSGS